MMETVLLHFSSYLSHVMPFFRPTRSALLVAALAVTLARIPAQSARPPAATPAPKSNLAPIQRHQHPNVRPTGEHLAEWMNSHKHLTPPQQQEALAREPGFSSLPPSTQQRMRDRLKQLDAMPPEKRQHILERNEAVEHMSSEQRVEVGNAMRQLAALPRDQSRYVARTFRGLRELTPEQRQNVLNSDRFSNLTEAQRATLNSLLKVEPLLPPPYDGAANPPPPHP